MHKFFLIRHGESWANVGLATTDPRNIALTPRGHEQARQIAAFLKDYTPLNLLVTSAYVRTQQTAAPTQVAFSNVPLEEWEVHEFTYLSSIHSEHSTSEQRRPLVDAYWEQCDPWYRDERGSESFKVFMGRVQAFIRCLKDRRKNIAIFSHEQFITAVLWILKNRPGEINSDMMQDFKGYLNQNRIPNGAIVEIKVRRSEDSQDAWTYEQITQHLERPVPGRSSQQITLAVPQAAMIR